MTEPAAPAVRYEIGAPAADIHRARLVRHAMPQAIADADCLFQFPSGYRCALAHGHLPEVPHIAIRTDREAGVTRICDVHDPAPSPSDDMRTRLVPTARQATAAAAILAADPAVQAVVCGLVLPGKDRGIWVTGQAVEEAPGLFLAADSLSYGTARNAAWDAAEAALAGADGTFAYIAIERGGFAAFES